MDVDNKVVVSVASARTGHVADVLIVEIWWPVLALASTRKTETEGRLLEAA